MHIGWGIIIVLTINILVNQVPIFVGSLISLKNACRRRIIRNKRQ